MVRTQSTTQVGVGSQDRDLATATVFLKEFFSGTAKQRARRLPKAPLAAIQRAAREDDDPFVRRTCLFFLDHYANDASMGVFGAALRDPVPFVRNMALHSLACESCKAEELCAAEVVPGVVELFEEDPNPELRSKALVLLLRLSGRDGRAWATLQRAAISDADPVIRRAATDAVHGRYVPPRKRYERRERRHAGGARRAASTVR